MKRHAYLGASCALATAIMLTAVAATSGGRAHAREPIDPAPYSATITNAYFPLSQLKLKVFEGTDTDPESGEVTRTRLESRVLPETATVAGVTVTVLEERAYDDGQLVELALDYFAQHVNGDVYYFGERVDNYEDGALRDHAGQWLAGEARAAPGVYVAAAPETGRTYEQEIAPGIAEDKSEVLAVGETVTVPAGTFTDCVRTRDYTPLEPGVKETKWHCAGIGLVREEGADSVNELMSVTRAAAISPRSPAVSTEVPTRPVRAPSAGQGDAGPGNSAWSIATAVAILAIVTLGAGALVRRSLR